MKKCCVMIMIWFLAIVFLFGCATTAKYKLKLGTWEGRHVDDLVMTWGPPQGTYTLSNGNTLVEYVNSENYQITGHQTRMPQRRYHDMVRSTGRSGTYITRTTPTVNYQSICKTRFLVNPSGEILSSSFAGDCYAK